eukprot:m.69971 g.69971  ORF g.69971 m.69971 type:complete len:57 (+) comp8293_c0_seq1:54-224(+)
MRKCKTLACFVQLTVNLISTLALYGRTMIEDLFVPLISLTLSSSSLCLFEMWVGDK